MKPRAQAQAAGLTRYFTGKPCPQGHVTERMASSGACVECNRLAKAKRYAADPATANQQKSAWVAANRKRANAIANKWSEANRAKKNASQARYRKENLQWDISRQAEWRAKNADRIRYLNARWYLGNRHKVAARDARRRAKLINAMPPWDSDLTDFVMAEASELAHARAAVTGFQWNIDHMIPLQARSVSGLHVWSNLQVIPERLNLSKNNRMMLTLPGEWIRFA